jgi:hypothetical protein
MELTKVLLIGALLSCVSAFDYKEELENSDFFWNNPRGLTSYIALQFNETSSEYPGYTITNFTAIEVDGGVTSLHYTFTQTRTNRLQISGVSVDGYEPVHFDFVFQGEFGINEIYQVSSWNRYGEDAVTLRIRHKHFDWYVDGDFRLNFPYDPWSIDFIAVNCEATVIRGRIRQMSQGQF